MTLRRTPIPKRKRGECYIVFEFWELESPAYRALSADATRVYIDLRKRLNFEFNFAASLDLQRFRDGKVVSLDDADNPVIERGDLLHVDFGVRLSGVVTDQQKMGYVLKQGESAPPPGLVKAFADSVRISRRAPLRARASVIAPG